MEKHQNSKCDSKKEPQGFKDRKSEVKIQKILTLDFFISKQACFKKILTIFIEKKELFASHLVKFHFHWGSSELSYMEFAKYVPYISI